MDQCMKSFQITIGQSYTVDNGTNRSIKTWGTVGQYFWSAEFAPNGNSSIFDLEGFKNVNIYGISVNGYLRGVASGTKCAVVTDWSFNLKITGTPPLISGTKRVSPDGFALYTNDSNVTEYCLSKTTNQIILSDPIASVKSIQFLVLQAQGVGAEFLNEVQLNYLLNFTFYYKYEGED